MSRAKIVLVGSNPSSKSPDTSSFHPDTRSGQIVNSWFEDMSVDLSFVNVSNKYTPNNRPLNISEIREALPALRSKVGAFDKVIALGRTAEKALSMLGIDFMHVPHPSGLNRFWNDADRSRDMIEALRSYVDGRDG